jgi:hypothetical protein
VHYQLADPDAIRDAIARWEPLKFSAMLVGTPAARIPFSLTKEEDRHIEKMLAQHEGGCEALPYILMKKIACVLKWWNGRFHAPSAAAKKMLSTLADFSEGLTKRGARVEL